MIISNSRDGCLNSVHLVVVSDSDGLIGFKGGIPWYSAGDPVSVEEKRFKAMTWGKPVIMGRRTFESLDGPLPGRLNLVLTRKPRKDEHPVYYVKLDEVSQKSMTGLVIDLVERVERFDPDLSTIAQFINAGEFFVIGGKEVYEQTKPSSLRVTTVDGCWNGDTSLDFYKIIGSPTGWGVIYEERVEPDHCPSGRGHTFRVYRKEDWHG